MTTADLIQVLREDVKRELLDEVMAELQPVIEKQLYANIFDMKEAVRFLKISDRTLRRMVAAGEIPYFRQRGLIYFRQVDLMKWIESRLEGGSRHVTG